MKKKTNPLKSVGFLLFMIASLGVGYIVGKMGYRAAIDIPEGVVIALVILFIPTFFLVIAIHEAGHALAGVLVKFDFKMYVVGPFMWEKEQTGWCFKWNKNVNTAGGLVICLPVGTEKLSKRFSIYAAGGPIASLVLAAVGYGLFRLMSAANTTNQVGIQTLAYFFFMLAMLSLLIFISTSIPIHTSGFSSDGARVLRLLQGGDTARFEILILKIITSSTGGVRPKLLDVNELEEAHALAIKLNSPFRVYLQSYFYQAAFDQGDIEKAEHHLHEVIRDADAIPAGVRNAVWLDAAFFYAYAKSDVDHAMKYWEQFKPAAMIPQAQIFATEAAISFLKKESNVLAAKIDASLKELPNMMDKGVAVALHDKLVALKENV